MTLDVQASDWSRVLAVPSQAIAFLNQPYNPVRSAEPTEDGVIPWALSGVIYARPMMKLQPMALAPAGSQYTMRVSTWAKLGTSNTRQPVWLQSAGWDFLCTVGDIPGVATAGGGGVEMDGDERFCSAVSLTGGNLGGGDFAGWVNSYGAGSKLAAWVIVPVLGARRVKVEFASADPSGAVGMNALWSQG